MSQQRPAIGDRFEQKGRIVRAVATGTYGRTLKCRNEETGRHSDISIHILRDRWTLVTADTLPHVIHMNEMPVSRKDFDALAGRVAALERRLATPEGEQNNG